MEKTLDATLDAYRDYVEQVPRPELRLLLAKPNKDDRHVLPQGRRRDNLPRRKDSVLPVGAEEELPGDQPRRPPARPQGDHVSVLHNLSLNLPRLSYESNQDETYFRAKLAMLMGVASDALITRRRLLERVMKKGLLPALSFGSDNVELRRDAAGNEPGRARRGALRT